MPFFFTKFERPIRVNCKSGNRTADIDAFIQSIIPLITAGEPERLSTGSHLLSDPIGSQILVRILVLSDEVAYITDSNPVIVNSQHPIHAITSTYEELRPLIYGAVYYSKD